MGLLDRWRLARATDVTVGDLLERLVPIGPSRRLMSEDDLALTYAEAADLVARWAGDIRGRITPGDRVVIATPNSYRVLLLMMAVCRAGGIAVPVNVKMRDAEIDHVVSDAAASLVLRSYDEVAAGDPVAASPASPTDLAALLYTSGTTGKPKGAELTHRALLRMAGSGALLPVPLHRTEAVSAMPVAHIAGISMLIMLAGLGLPVRYLVKFRPDDVLDAIESRRASMFVGVPAMYRMMLEAGAASRDLKSVRLWASGADAMPADIARQFQRFGSAVTLPGLGPRGLAAFIDGYGMVELAGGVAVKVSPPGVRLPFAGLLGVPMPGYKLRVVDESGQPVEMGSVGELIVHGPGVMRGYHGRAGDDALSADGWLRTGDLARRRPLGTVEFAGRKKDVIKHGGYSVFAAEVEAVLEEHPAVAEAAVIGIPDDRKGQLPAAVVRLKGSVTADDLQAWAAERLSEYKVPVRIIVRPDLPRTGTDKVDKKALLADFD